MEDDACVVCTGSGCVYGLHDSVQWGTILATGRQQRYRTGGEGSIFLGFRNNTAHFAIDKVFFRAGPGPHENGRMDEYGRGGISGTMARVGIVIGPLQSHMEHSSAGRNGCDFCVGLCGVVQRRICLIIRIIAVLNLLPKACALFVLYLFDYYKLTKHQKTLFGYPVADIAEQSE